MNRILSHAAELVRSYAASTRCINRRHSFSKSNHGYLGDEAEALEYAAKLLDDIACGKAKVVYAGEKPSRLSIKFIPAFLPDFGKRMH